MKAALQAPSKTRTQSAASPWTAPLITHHCACGLAAGLDGRCGDCRRQAFVGNVTPLVQSKPPVGRLADNNARYLIKTRAGHDFSRMQISIGYEVDLFRSIQSALSSAGQPLSEQSRQNFIKEGLSKEKIHAIRIHTDHQAIHSARLLGARAYQAGEHIVFGAGFYQPESNNGNKLLRHEVAHVIQTEGRVPTSKKIASQGSMSERQATKFADQKRVNSGMVPLTVTQPAYHLLVDPRLGEVLERIRQLPTPYSSQAKAEQIYEMLRGRDLNNPDNLTPVVTTIDGTFGIDERGSILTSFLSLIDSERPFQSELVTGQPSAEDEARMQRQMQMMQIGPRGPYRQHGVGLLFPVFSQPARPLLPLLKMFESAENAFAGAGSFLKGVLTGLQGSMTEEDLEQLAYRLLQSSALNIVFPVVFISGAVVGIIEDVIDTVKGTYELITDFEQFLEDMKAFLSAFLGPDSREVGREIGEECGRNFGDRLTDLARGNVFEFSYGMGRMIGPTIVYTILALMNVPQLVAPIIIARLLVLLRPILERSPRLSATFERIARRLPGKESRTSKGEPHELDIGSNQTEAGQSSLQPIVHESTTDANWEQLGKELRTRKRGQGNIPPSPTLDIPENIAVPPQEYLDILTKHPFLFHHFDEISNAVDRVGEAAANHLINPTFTYHNEFLDAVTNGRWTDAGNYFHIAAKEAGDRMNAGGLLPSGFEFEYTIKAGSGGSRADIFIRDPNGALFEVDWKTTGKSGLRSKSQMSRHAEQIEERLTIPLSGQASRSWVDYVRGHLIFRNLSVEWP